MTSATPPVGAPDIRDARRLFPATKDHAYLNTASVGLASRHLAETYHRLVERWTDEGFDFAEGERAANASRSAVARLIGADSADVALIPSLSSVAGLVGASLDPASAGENIVVGAREYSSNNFPWRQLEHKGYDVRLVPFRNGGLEAEDIADHVDRGTRLVAFSGVQSATGHRSDIVAISGIARAVGATVFVDGSQLVGAMPVAEYLPNVDVLATSDHKFLLNAGRGMGYCYLSPVAQSWFTPINAGWRAGADPMKSFFGPEMTLSTTASRFDSSISWMAAIGNEAALRVFDDFGTEAVYERNLALTTLLRSTLLDIGWDPLEVPEQNRSTIVSVPLGDHEPTRLLAALSDRRVTCSVRDGNLRVTVHFYNDEDDLERLAAALTALR